MGIEFREGSLLIGPKTQFVVRKGQVYNLNVGLSGLVNKAAEDKEGKNYALFVGDTVVVNEVRVFDDWFAILYHTSLKIIHELINILSHENMS
ncbi:hypothetical protein LSTR_LSTR017215 [Laodelphax striatellus]|uniref:FACT complex subunit n=1 Tax=Laodelphax striatellus TaxID=195883 RepID=A0A482WVZ8_LAOST|nr:hypothetical protein LSTR_LSTR017215 [Laodelphax striatellus]